MALIDVIAEFRDFSSKNMLQLLKTDTSHYLVLLFATNHVKVVSSAAEEPAYSSRKDVCCALFLCRY